MSLRGGGREAVEDTPVTGARTWDWLCDYCEAAIDEESNAETRLEMRALLDSARAVLNGVVRAEDALTAEDRAVIGHVERFVRTLNPQIDDAPEVFQAHLARLRAIAAGGPA